MCDKGCLVPKPTVLDYVCSQITGHWPNNNITVISSICKYSNISVSSKTYGENCQKACKKHRCPCDLVCSFNLSAFAFNAYYVHVYKSLLVETFMLHAQCLYQIQALNTVVIVTFRSYQCNSLFTVAQ